MKSDVAFVLENAGWPALLVDEACNVRRANQAAIQAFGSTLEGEARLSAIWSPENEVTPEQFLAGWERSPAPVATLRLRGKGGLTTEHSVCICAATRDGQKYFTFQLLPASANESKTQFIESATAHKQKLDCALQLARTVALDFNNALTSILGHTSLVLAKMESNSPWRRSLMEVEKSAARAAEIANDLGTFSRQERDTRTQLSNNLNQLLQPNVELIKNAHPNVTQWTMQLERRLFSAKFDEAKMQQAFMRILENAVEALRDHGAITVQTRNLELTEPTQDRNVRLAAGCYVCVEISDNGCGIEPDVLPRIFEPFFTTKRGPHRGLGLAWVYGIVTNHGGGVAVSSRPGAGTSVRVYLPAEKKFVRDDVMRTDDLHGTETVLMVDDEDLLLTMGQTILSAYGYTVATASSGQRAVEMITKAVKPFDLLITDMVMPNMSGRELVERVRRISPSTRILCSSGFVRPNSHKEAGCYLQKPFTSQDLLQKVKEALTESSDIS